MKSITLALILLASPVYAEEVTAKLALVHMVMELAQTEHGEVRELMQEVLAEIKKESIVPVLRQENDYLREELARCREQQ